MMMLNAVTIAQCGTLKRHAVRFSRGQYEERKKEEGK